MYNICKQKLKCLPLYLVPKYCCTFRICTCEKDPMKTLLNCIFIFGREIYYLII